MALKVAINGTGRIGIIAIKIAMSREDIDLVAINTTADMDMLKYLLKYDTMHKGIDAQIVNDNTMKIAGKDVTIFSTRNPDELGFGKCGAKVVIECTGAFLTTEKCKAYLKDGVEKVVMSAPAKDDTPTFVLNINTDKYNGETIISNASCTTNCLAPNL